MRLRKAIVDFDLEGARRGAVTRFCQANGISRSVFYKIRSQASGLDPGQTPGPGSRAPRTTPSRTAPDVEELALELRRELKAAGWDAGPLSVRARMVRAGRPDVPSRATLARIFTRHGVVEPEPSKRPRASYKTFRWPRANDMWQLDGTEWRLDDERHTRQCVYQVEDDHSRMIMSWALDASENGQTAIEVVADAIGRWGAPVRFLTDNGAAFNLSRRGTGAQAPLERFLKSLGVEPISGQVHKPTTQGKNERLHFTLQKFLEAHRPIETPERLTELLGQFADEYNNERPHQRLRDGTETPAEAYAAAVKAPSPEPPPARPAPARTEPPDPARPARRRPYRARQADGVLMVDRRVSSEGRVSVANCLVYVGKTRAGRTMHIIVDDDRLELFTTDGLSLAILPRPAPGSPRTRYNITSDGPHCG
jgi:transposase InsO family protein